MAVHVDQCVTSNEVIEPKIYLEPLYRYDVMRKSPQPIKGLGKKHFVFLLTLLQRKRSEQWSS